jgi:hypothetical protein
MGRISNPAQHVGRREAARAEDPGARSCFAPNRASHQPMQVPERRPIQLWPLTHLGIEVVPSHSGPSSSGKWPLCAARLGPLRAVDVAPGAGSNWRHPRGAFISKRLRTLEPSRRYNSTCDGNDRLRYSYRHALPGGWVDR